MKLKEILESFIKFKIFKIDPLKDFCDVQELETLQKNGVKFPYPYGVIIHQAAKIGKNCTIYQNVTIGTGNAKTPGGPGVPVIEDNVTIYANACINGEITVGKNSIIGAGSVVSRDVEPNTVVAGVPARLIKRL